MTYNVDRTRNRKRGDGLSARHGLEHDYAKSIRLAWEYKHVGTRKVSRKISTKLVAGKQALRVFGDQSFAVRPVADNDFAAGKLKIQELVNIFFNSDVYTVRAKLVEFTTYGSTGEKSQSNFRIGGTRHRAPALRRDHQHLVSHGDKLVAEHESWMTLS